MTDQLSPAESRRIAELILTRDRFSSWAGIEIVSVDVAVTVLRMTVRADMINGFGVGHGGITFSLADTALAIAANKGGHVSLALEVNMSFIAATYEGDELTVSIREESDGARIGVYTATVTNQRGRTVGLFRGTVYKTNRLLEK